ncbi:monocarboxylate transporter 3 [Aplysia californica]|uniref:Monocarboxylate transporter 3 n=1 Tax=Aplysia californica TaxID=6500 RepID=A0ABM0K3F9_APLCA|nr:monocarboxylate transporter 3 [Aplysia californica]
MASAEVGVAPDGGWGWAVAVGGFFVSFFLDGLEYSYGVLLPHLRAEFKADMSLLTFTGGLLTGVCLGMGPITAVLVVKFGCRPVAFAGGLLASLSLIVATRVPTIELFIVFYGGFTGVGIGLIYLPSITTINRYFHKKRGVVVGVATSGSGLGLLVLAILIDLLISEYGWRGCYLIIAAVYLHLCVCASLMRPLGGSHVKTADGEEEVGCSDSGGVSEGEECLVVGETRVCPDGWGDVTVGKTCPSEQCDLGTGQGQGSNYNVPVLTSTQTPHIEQTLLGKDQNDKNLLLEGSKYPRGFSGSSNKDGVNDPLPSTNHHQQMAQQILQHHSHHHKPHTHHGSLQDTSNNELLNNLPSDLLHIPPECISVSSLSIASLRSRSLQSLRAKSLNTSCTHSHLSVDQKVVVAPDVTARVSPLSLLRLAGFDLFCVGAFLIQVAASIPAMFTPSYTLSLGLDQTSAATVVSVLGIANTVGRLVAGFLAYLKVGSVRIYNTGTFLAGLACYFLPACTTYPTLLTFAVCHGFFLGAFPPLQSVILVEQLGLSLLPASLGIVCLCKSVASVVGPTLAGALFEAVGTYSVPFYFAGGILTLSTVLHCVMSFCPRPQTQ